MTTIDGPDRSLRRLRATATVRTAPALVAALLAVLAAAPCARAQDTIKPGVRLSMTYTGTGKPWIVVTPVTGPNADSVRTILGRDFTYSDRLSVLPVDSGEAPTGALNYDVYAKLNALAIVQASVTPAGALHVAVHEVSQKRVVLVVDLPLPTTALSADWRRVVHIAADSAEWAILGQKGISSTRIAFVKENQIWTVDQDGGAVIPVSGTKNGLSPVWSADGKYFAFNVLPDPPPAKIVVRDMTTGKDWPVHVGATNQTPAFAPGSSTMAFSSGNDGASIYTVTPFSSDAPLRITSRGSSINASPTWSPDGTHIAFTSDLIGHTEVYIMDADGSNAEVLTNNGFGDDLYRTDPHWSPDGKRVAYTSRINHVFQVMMISVRDRSTTQLTSEGSNEFPSWAPDARHIVFVSNRGGSRQLWVLDTESAAARQITHGSKVQNPAWSPRLDVARQP